MASIVSVAVHVRDSTRAGLRQVQNSINGLNRGILQSMSDTFSDGIGQSIATGLKAAMSNPYVMGAIVALTATLVTAIGAAIAGALVLAFGGAFVALGVMGAMSAKSVQKAFQKELKTLRKEFADASKPLIPVLEHAAKKMGELGKAFAPHFKEAMKKAAPVLDDFIDELGRGIKKFGATAFDPMMNAFNRLVAAMDWEGFFSDLGTSFEHLGNAVGNNADAVAGVLDALLGALPKAINMVASLTEGWARIKPHFEVVWSIVSTALTPAFEVLVFVLKGLFMIQEALHGPLSLLARAMRKMYDEALVPLGNYISSVLAPIWRGLVEGFEEGWKKLEVGLIPVLRDLWQVFKDTAREVLATIPGLEGLADKSQNAGKIIKEWIIDRMIQLSDWLIEHREDIKNWAEKAAEAVTTLAQWIANLVTWLSIAFGWISRNWEMIWNFSGWGVLFTIINYLTIAWNWVSRHWNLAFSLSGIGWLFNLVDWLRIAWGWISRHWAAVVSFSIPGIGSIIGQVQTLWGWVSRSWSRNVNFHFSMSGAVDSIRGMLGFAHGGVIGHAATGGVRNGMTMVGEHGPELVNLAPGSHVRSNPDTERLLGQGGNGGGSTLVLKSSGRRVDDMLIEILREAIHQRGGDPVTVLGGR